VRIARAPLDLSALESGEVLVVPLLTPAWVPLAAHAAAAVVDTGNHLMHACVLAREIGLPCVVGTGDATSRLRTGDVVEVDGAAGTVERLDG
jgi:pyruvate,water dikinase